MDKDPRPQVLTDQSLDKVRGGDARRVADATTEVNLTSTGSSDGTAGNFPPLSHNKIYAHS